MKTLTNLFKRIWQFIKSLFTLAEPASTKPVVQYRTVATRSAQSHHVNSYSRRPWTKEEEDYLTDSYSEKENLFLSSALNRSQSSVQKKARALGLKKSTAFFRTCGRNSHVRTDETIEIKLSRIMDMQLENGGFCVELYYDNLAPNNESCVARYREIMSPKVYYARCNNFADALDRIQEYITALQNQ